MRARVIAALAVLMSASFFVLPGAAEILSRGSLDSREAYYERVTRLSAQLRADVAADAPREALRQVAVTLAAALTDLAFSEAGARSGKVGPPEDAALRPGASEPESAAAPGPPVAISEVPYEWFIDRLDRARARARTIVERLDEEGAAAADIAPAVAEAETLIEEMRRPPAES